MSGLFPKKLRPWPKVQTLFVKHWRFCFISHFLQFSRGKKHSLTWLSNVYENSESIFCFSQTNNVWQAMFVTPQDGQKLCLISKRQVKHVWETMFDRLSKSKIVFHKQIWNVWQTMFDCFARANIVFQKQIWNVW